MSDVQKPVFRFSPLSDVDKEMARKMMQQQQEQPRNEPRIGRRSSKNAKRDAPDPKAIRTTTLCFTELPTANGLMFLVGNDNSKDVVMGQTKDTVALDVVKEDDAVVINAEFNDNFNATNAALPSSLDVDDVQFLGLTALLNSAHFAKLCDYKTSRIIFVWADSTTLKNYKRTLKLVQRAFRVATVKPIEMDDDTQAVEFMVDKEVLGKNPFPMSGQKIHFKGPGSS